MTFTCDLCKYSDSKKSNFLEHVKSKKHLNNCTLLKLFLNNDNQCVNKDDHYQQLLQEKDKMIYEKDKALELLKNQDTKLLQEKDKALEMLKTQDGKLLEEKDKTIKILSSQVNAITTITKSCRNEISPSISVIQYVTQNFNDAPHLTIFENYDKEKKELEKKELEKYELNKTIPINKYVYAERLVNYYNHDKLIHTIGNTIIEEYKKDDASQQALWTSDTARLTYLIKELLKDNTSNWVIDRNGIKTSKYLIDPLLISIRNDLYSYALKPLTSMSELSSNEIELQSKYMYISHKIINLIDNGTLRKNILKEITPAFYMSQNRRKNISKPNKVNLINKPNEPKQIEPKQIEPIQIEPIQIEPIQIE